MAVLRQRVAVQDPADALRDKSDRRASSMSAVAAADGGGIYRATVTHNRACFLHNVAERSRTRAAYLDKMIFYFGTTFVDAADYLRTI
ncbi:hypothetical protein [Sphingomonas sp. S2M10]|uniref:hypothetical protein n=1 Tax=Sphingomonas sp. S2M10 TaxID=2705010 RepID=UPI001B3B1E3E|nr:hypothetical protein [Sphingomonas sp. S2M10]